MSKIRGFTLKRELIKKYLQGFTLIEVLIVIAILGILASTVLIAVYPTKRRNQAKDAIIKSDILTIASVLEAVYVSKGGYPHGGTAMSELVANRELKTEIVPPPGKSLIIYVITTFPVNCASNGPIFCTSVSVYYPLFDPSVPGNLWCYRSSQARASEVTSSAGCPAP